MKIYINTNKEMISFHYDGDSEHGKKNFVDHVLKSDIDYDIMSLPTKTSTILDSNFQNWNGGKHSRFAQCLGSLWCSHQNLPLEIEASIDKIVNDAIREANRIEVGEECKQDKREHCWDNCGDDDQ